MLDAHQLNIFLAAAESLSFTQAAQRTHMTQPSVSQHIQALERYFGIQLFIRSGRNLELTDAGIALVPLAREMVDLSNRIEETMISMSGTVCGHLHVACSTTPGKYILPQLLASIHRLHPQVRATCSVYSQAQSLQMLVEGMAHFALSSRPMEAYPETEFEEFFCDDILLIAPAGHPWAERGEISVEELGDADFILREEGSGTYTAVRSALAEGGIAMNQLRVLLTLGNSEAIALSVQEGLGVGFVSEIVTARLGLNRVAVVGVKGLRIYRQIYIGRNVRRAATFAQNAFWEFATAQKQMFLKDFTAPIWHCQESVTGRQKDPLR